VEAELRRGWLGNLREELRATGFFDFFDFGFDGTNCFWPSLPFGERRKKYFKHRFFLRVRDREDLPAFFFQGQLKCDFCA
jgi:hypothetical protein